MQRGEITRPGSQAKAQIEIHSAIWPRVLGLSSFVTCCLCNGTVGDRPISGWKTFPESSQLRVSLCHMAEMWGQVAGFSYGWLLGDLCPPRKNQPGPRAQGSATCNSVLWEPQAALGSPHLLKHTSQTLASIPGLQMDGVPTTHQAWVICFAQRPRIIYLYHCLDFSET